jgi:hypothetical protein
MSDQHSLPRAGDFLPLKPGMILPALPFMLAGAALFVNGARGDLWLDEIWSLNLIEPVTSFGDILWGINHDNNHVLNSMYLYLIGTDASPIALRGLSVVFGVISIAVAGLVLLRNGAIPAMVGMALFAVSYPVVHYASEARGYAGVIVFSLLSLLFLQREFQQPSAANRQALGVWLALGVLCHLSMLFAATAFGLWTLWVQWQAAAGWRAWLYRSSVTLIPAVCWTSAAAITVGYSALRHGIVEGVRSDPLKFTIGGINPFSYDSFIEAYGNLIRLLAGVPAGVPPWLCLGAAAALMAIAAFLWRDRSDPKFSLYVISTIVLPAVALAANPVNSGFPRYFLFSGVMFLLFMADLAGFAWQQKVAARAVAAVAVLATVTGNAVSLSHFFADGRGHYSEVVAEMGKAGRVVYSSDHGFRTPTVVDYFGRRLGIEATYLPWSNRCAARPDWIIVENPNNPLLAYRQATLRPAQCAITFERVGSFPFWGLSGRTWVLFRRTN